MLLRSFRLAGGCLAASLAIAAAAPRSAHAAGPTKAECIDAYTSGQQLKKRGELRAAEERLLVCSRDPCPAGLQGDCSDWLGEVQRLQPSIVVVAKDEAGHELTDVRVFVDGTLAASRLDGRSLAIDPGDRDLRFEAAGHGSASQHILVREGQKAREIAVHLRRLAPPASDLHTPPASGDRPADAPPKAEDGSSSRWPVWLAGGVSVAALGTFAGFGIAGVSQRADLLATCNHACSDADKESVDRKFLVADVALGVAVIAGAATALLLLTGSSSSTGRSP